MNNFTHDFFTVNNCNASCDKKILEAKQAAEEVCQKQRTQEER